LSDRVCDVFSNLDVPVSSIESEIDQVTKLKSEAHNCMEMEKSFGTVESLNGIWSRMLNSIAEQKHTELVLKYDEFKNSSVKIENQQISMIFKVKVSDLDKAHDDKISFEDKINGYTLLIHQNTHNSDGFDVFLRNDNPSQIKFKLIPKMQLKNINDSSLVMGNLECILTSEQPETKVAKIIILNSANLQPDRELDITAQIEELENSSDSEDGESLGNDKVEISMLLGLQQEITTLIIENIQKNNLLA
jgi:hypothetical protein